MTAETNRRDRTVTFSCDGEGCGADREFYDVSFPEAVEELKGEDWRIKKRGADWLHFCPDCAI